MFSTQTLARAMVAASLDRSTSVQARDLALAFSGAAKVGKRSIRKLLLPLLRMVSRSDVLVADSAGSWQSNGENFFLPRFIFQRTPLPKPRSEVGIFAGVNGRDLGGVRGVSEFLCALNAHPAIGREYRLWLYPLCDPIGYLDQSYSSDLPLDRTTKFWNDLDSPEAQLIGKEISERQFDGLILLRGASQVGRIQVQVSGPELDFVTPALLIAEQALPATHRAAFAGFSVNKVCQRKSIISGADPRARRFELILEIPRQISLALQGQLFLVSLHAILAAYRRISSEAGSQVFKQ